MKIFSRVCVTIVSRRCVTRACVASLFFHACVCDTCVSHACVTCVCVTRVSVSCVCVSIVSTVCVTIM